MRKTSFQLLTIVATVAFASHALAQGDDCTGALNVVQGANGPFTNVGSTTSLPAWPCAAGGNDVWFSYIAPGNGSLTADLCGSGYDTALEIFDGTAGCGGLVSMMCNDDSCGLQSLVTVNVTLGTTYFLRVGGYASSTGTFMLNINGPLAPGQVVATASSVGTGCVARPGSFYEGFVDPSVFDLAGSAMTLLHTGAGYIAIPLGTFVPPTPAALALALGDDTEVTQPLTTPFPYDGGSTTSLTICSNGYVSVASGNGTGYAPSTTTLLNAAHTGWRCWHDYNPTIAGSGQVKFEEVAGIAYVTWDGVYDFGRASGGSTWQMQFDTTNGNVTFAWQTIDPQGSTTNVGNQFLVGYSAGGASLDPGAMDISAALPNTFNCGPDLQAIALNAGSRPIGGTSINLDTSNIGSSAPFGAITLGFNNPATDLTGIGMAGCTQYTHNLATLLYVTLGAPSVSTPFSVPGQPFAIGLHIFAQSIVYDPASGLTLLGALASNGLDLTIGNL